MKKEFKLINDARDLTVLDNQYLGSNLGSFFKRQLENIVKTTYKRKLTPLSFVECFAVNTSQWPEWANQQTYHMSEPYGGDKEIANWGDDLPEVGVGAKEITYYAKDFGTSYHYTFHDIRAAQVQGVSLTGEKLFAARRVEAQRLNNIGYYGHTQRDGNPKGILNFEHFPREIFPVAIDASSTPEQIVTAMHSFCNGIYSRTNGVHRPTMLLMPIDEYQYIATTQKSDASDATILDFFLATSPYITQVKALPEMAPSAGENQNGISGRFMVACDPSQEVISFHVPQTFTVHPMQKVNLSFKSNITYKFGGIVSNYPQGLAIAELPSA